MNRHVILMAALVCVLLSAACAVKRSESPLAVEPQTRIEVSVPQTVGPVVVGRWTKAGPYEVRLDEATVTAKASVPDYREPRQPDGLAGRKRGDLLVLAWVSVRNPATSSDATLPAPSRLRPRLELPDGRSLQPGGEGMSRSMGTSQPPFANGPGPMMDTPLRPGETMCLDEQFLVRPPATDAVLVMTFDVVRSSYVVRFAIN